MTAVIVHAETQGALPVALGACHARSAWVQWVAGDRDRYRAAAVHRGQGEIFPGREQGSIRVARPRRDTRPHDACRVAGREEHALDRHAAFMQGGELPRRAGDVDRVVADEITHSRLENVYVAWNLEGGGSPVTGG